MAVETYSWFGFECVADVSVPRGMISFNVSKLPFLVPITDPDSWVRGATAIAFNPDDKDKAFVFARHARDVVLKRER